MTSLYDFLSESISRGISKNKYSKFPVDNIEDRQEVENWLNKNGYVEIKDNTGHQSRRLKNHHTGTGEKCYIVGPFDNYLVNKGNKKSNWIMFYDGNSTYLLMLDNDVADKRSMNGNQITKDGDNYPTYVTLDELVKEIQQNG